MNIYLSTGDATPRSKFNTAGAITSLTYPTYLCRCPRRQADGAGSCWGRSSVGSAPQGPAFPLAPWARGPWHHRRAILVWSGGRSPPWVGDKMAASVVHRFLKLRGVAPWRNRCGAWEGCLGARGGLGQSGVGREESFIAGSPCGELVSSRGHPPSPRARGQVRLSPRRAGRV